MEGHVTDVEQDVIITNSNLLLHFSGHNNDLLVLKQWKGALNRIMLSPLGLLKNNDLALRYAVIVYKKASELRHYPIGGFHVTSLPPYWRTVNKRLLISSLCLSTSICSFHHYYLCLRRLHENHLYIYYPPGPRLKVGFMKKPRLAHRQDGKTSVKKQNVF